MLLKINSKRKGNIVTFTMTENKLQELSRFKSCTLITPFNDDSFGVILSSKIICGKSLEIFDNVLFVGESNTSKCICSCSSEEFAIKLVDIVSRAVDKINKFDLEYWENNRGVNL